MMDQEFRDLYNRELRVLREDARDFAEEFPGIASRLGGIVGDNADPMITGLLQGSAFLAARVQLKLRHEFPEFTANLLELLLPNVLAPTPSTMLLQVRPTFGDPALREGQTIAAGSYLDSTYLVRDRQVSCRFQTRQDLTIWPLELAEATYAVGPGEFQARGIPVGPDIQAGLTLSLRMRSTARVEDELVDEQTRDKPENWVSGCRIDSLRFHLLGPIAEAVMLYEQIMAHAADVYLRYEDPAGDPVAIRLRPDSLSQVGFDDEEALLPRDGRMFRGFELLREFFIFPRKFLGFEVGGLRRHLAQIQRRGFEIVVLFNDSQSRLAAAVSGKSLGLFCAPAVNLFEKSTDRVAVRRGHHEYQIVPDRSQLFDFEPHRVLSVFGHFGGSADKLPIQPLYSAPNPDDQSGGGELFYTIRRVPHHRSSAVKRAGTPSNYVGTDVYISISAPREGTRDEDLTELSVRALCSNRHLPEHLPVGDHRPASMQGSEFRFINDVSLDVYCVSGPTPPREPLAGAQRTRRELIASGSNTWRLINMLSVNHLGLIERGAGRNGRALQEVLSAFADLTDPTIERAIRGIRSVDSRPIVRRIAHRHGVGAARGIEITVTVDEKAFEGFGVFHLGAVLDRFFAEYAAMNHFTQTVIRSNDRGDIMRWPPRAGCRRPL